MTTQSETKWNRVWRPGWLPAVLVAGLWARFWAGTCGHNYDFDSYRLVTGILEQGGNVYAGTCRYNYGPVWFHLLHLFDWLAGRNPEVFRWLLIGFLSAVDAGIAWVLWRKFGRRAATLFFLNPVSILITGYHNQFDNTALLLGLCAVLLFGDDFHHPVGRRKFAGLVVLGLSLMTKHILFAFPLWLAVKQKGHWQKCLVLLVPVAIFLSGFAPYWAEGRAGILANVFLYKSRLTAYLYNFAMPAAIHDLLSAEMVWLVLLGGFAFVLRRKSALETLLFYTGVLVAASPATLNEYLAIPVAFTAVHVNCFTVSYTILAACLLSADAEGPHLFHLQTAGNAGPAVYLLALALLWGVWRDNLFNLLNICRREINLQLGPEAGRRP